MSRLRLLFFWLLVLLLPVQGFAAATKLWCGSAGAAGHQHLESAAANHSHGPQPAGLDRVDSHGHGDARTADSARMEAPVHQCGLCAACCHVVGVAPAHGSVPASAVPQSGLAEVTGRIADRCLGHPEKPPRG
jgi:hypothetical protein